MIKKILATLLALFAAVAFAAVDANKATQAELETVKGIGPAISAKIIDERSKGAFKDWQDMVDRVKGVGEKNAATFSTGGLTVNGAAFAGAPAATGASPKKAATPTPVPPAAIPTPAKTAATAAPAAPASAAMSADDKKAAAAQAKADKKAAKAAAADASKQTKAEKKTAKAAAAASAASAAKK